MVYLIHKPCIDSELQHKQGKNSTKPIAHNLLVTCDDSTSLRTPQISYQAAKERRS